MPRDRCISPAEFAFGELTDPVALNLEAELNLRLLDPNEAPREKLLYDAEPGTGGDNIDKIDVYQSSSIHL